MCSGSGTGTVSGAGAGVPEGVTIQGHWVQVHIRVTPLGQIAENSQ